MRASKFSIFIVSMLTLGFVVLAYLLYTTSALISQIERNEEGFGSMYGKAQDVMTREELDCRTAVQYCNDFASDIITNNRYVPVVIVEDDERIVATNQDDIETAADTAAALQLFRTEGRHAAIDLGETRQTVYYLQSELISKLNYVRWTQIFAVILFAVVVYLYLTRVRRRERDNLWKGLARETAHQLGTPISALGAWRELLASGMADSQFVAEEMQKDIERLNSIATRFSKVGSVQQLTDGLLVDDVRAVVEYLRVRISKNISISIVEREEGVSAPHEPTLIRWAVENICKNAADAIGKEGEIIIFVGRHGDKAVIDIRDNGKGMDQRTRRHVFDAGYSTKKRGWGIGLALVRRIANEYHHGRVFVLDSKPGVGTTFRIELPTAV